jgi:hypothetical protein
MATKSFDKWDTDDVERTFGLERVRHSPVFDAWMAAQHTPEQYEQSMVEALREELAEAVDSWNEDELKFRFIAPFIGLMRYNSTKINSFTQRPLTAKVLDITLTGRVDFMIATGRTKPRQPFFFLHEYKKERTGDSDPRAQLLTEMLAARELNHVEYPLYGTYIVGRNWFFVVLEGSQYAESLAYDATQDDIFNIFSILREAKTIILRLAERYI